MNNNFHARALKTALEQMAEPERYAELMKRFKRGELIPRQFRFFVSYYEMETAQAAGIRTDLSNHGKAVPGPPGLDAADG